MLYLNDNKICQTSYFHIRARRHVRSSMSTNIAKSVASAIVGARLDYCNSLLYGVSAANLHKVHHVQNTVVRVVTGTKKRDRITPVLQALHWLPVNFIITCKITILTYKVKLIRQPEYLLEYIQSLVRSRNLRSSGTLYIPDSNLAPTKFLLLSRRAFSFAAPTIWNSLPIHLRSLATAPTTATFIKHLKTYLFSLAYPV